MAYNDIQYLKGSDTVNSSVDIINKNFKSLKDAISAGNISLAKYDQDIQEMIEKLKSDFSNVTDAIYTTLDITQENWTKKYKQLEAKTESAAGDLAEATMTLQAYSNEDVTGAIAELEAKVSGIDTDTILSQLSLLAEKTADTELAVATLRTLIGGSDWDSAEIAAGIESIAKRMGDIETAQVKIETKIDSAESSITSLTAKTSELLTTQNQMTSEIDGVSASLGTCVKKDADGKIESSAYIAADKIDFTASEINFTGTGLFKGDVKASSFAVMNNKDKETIKFTTWTSEDKSAYTSVSIEEGTPVLIATTYESDGVTVSKQYVTSMMELVSSGTNVTESCTSAIYLNDNNNFTAKVLCDSSSNLFNNNVYKVGDTYRTGTTINSDEADGIYLERSSIEMFMKIQIGSTDYYFNVPWCYKFVKYEYNGGNLAAGGNTYYCVPTYMLSESGGYYTLTFKKTSASDYRFVTTISTTSESADVIQASIIDGSPYTLTQFNEKKQAQNVYINYVSSVESSSTISSGHTDLEYEKYPY